MSDLLNRLKSVGSIKTAEVLKESAFFNKKDVIKTDLPILNIAFSGQFDGGLVSGLSIFSGESKSYKTLLSLYCMKAYLTKYDNAIALLYDSEFGITPDYLLSQGIDTSRVLHIPIEHVEQLKFDIVKRLEEIKQDDKVFIMIDSLGALASKKEVEDALDEKSVADMTRAKAIRSLLRIITPHLTLKSIPCIVVNHVYKTMELYSKTIQGGGSSVLYSANQVFVITRSQDKTGDDIVGWNFTINIEKSRFVKEKSKLCFNVNYETGINKFSGLLDLALESGHVIKPSNGRYQRVDKSTGELTTQKLFEKDTNNTEFWKPILADKTFHDFVKTKYQLATGAINHLGEDDE